MTKDIDFNIECWYKAGCPLLKYKCEKTCHRYLEMNFLISNCGMPNADKYIKPLVPAMADEPAFDKLQEIKENIEVFVKSGSNLYITSKYDKNGKTTWALKILYRYFDRIWSGNGFKVRGYFIYTPDFLSELRSFSYKDTDEYKELKDILYNADLVIWDDVTSTKCSTVDQNNLNMFLNKRTQNDKANIFTGYLLGDELNEQVGNQIAKKITYDLVVEFSQPGKSELEYQERVKRNLEKQKFQQ